MEDWKARWEASQELNAFLIEQIRQQALKIEVLEDAVLSVRGTLKREERDGLSN